jgi:hypothetical protein
MKSRPSCLSESEEKELDRLYKMPTGTRSQKQEKHHAELLDKMFRKRSILSAEKSDTTPDKTVDRNQMKKLIEPSGAENLNVGIGGRIDFLSSRGLEILSVKSSRGTPLDNSSQYHSRCVPLSGGL